MASGRLAGDKNSRGTRAEEVVALYYTGDYNLRVRTPKAGVDVCFNGNIAVSQVKLL